jgi:GH25 family lysozyme M1 (1,4-beta-N-acetylmuramidase)
MAELNAVVDLSYHNGLVTFAKAKKTGLLGAIHKATQGTQYSDPNIRSIDRTAKDPSLSNCWFWLSQYGSTAVVPPNWKGWTLWQYTDRGLGPEPHEVPGIGRCDRDKSSGDATALAKF